MTRPRTFTRIVDGLPAAIPFVGPEALERARGEAFRVRLGANESAFGIAPGAATAMREAIEHIAWYADPEGYELRGALATLHRTTPERICLGSGIDDLLGTVVRVLVEPGAAVVTSLGGYPTFEYHVAGFGGTLHRVPYRDDHNDLEALADMARHTDAALVYLANPDNPMGTWHPGDTRAEFVERLPAGATLILDEAYIEFAPAGVAPPIDADDARVIRMRTFSKAHGMAGARIGYAVAAPETVVALNKVRNHFGVNRVAQAGALASLGEPEFVAGVVAEVARGRAEYAALASACGITTLPSATNFVAFDTGSGDRARALLAALAERGAFVRMPGVAPLDRCVRITVGNATERALLAELLAESLAAADRTPG